MNDHISVTSDVVIILYNGVEKVFDNVHTIEYDTDAKLYVLLDSHGDLVAIFPFREVLSIIREDYN